MKKTITTLAALALAACMGAVAPAALAQNVAIVNGKAIPKERLEALAQQVARSGRPVTPDMQGQLRDEIIAREVFAQEAQARGSKLRSEAVLARLTTVYEAAQAASVIVGLPEVAPVADELLKTAGFEDQGQDETLIDTPAPAQPPSLPAPGIDPTAPADGAMQPPAMA